MALQFDSDLCFRTNQQHLAAKKARCLNGCFHSLPRRVVAAYSIKNYTHCNP
jgi:hypothetical protein